MAALDPLFRRRSLIAAGAAIALSACDRASSPSTPPSGSATAPAPAALGFAGIDITGAEYARELSLPDVDGRVRTLAEFKGKVVVVFFGYTQCPDVCPTTMVELAGVKKALGPAGDDVQGIFITVDPERDTPQLLKAYVDNFGAGFVALRGNAEETKAAAKHFKVFYAKVPGRNESSYTVDHTAGSFVFDRAGRIRLFTRYGSGAEGLRSDLQRLLAEKA
jgi:protein SCO1/2